jgi:hypothetical protein
VALVSRGPRQNIFNHVMSCISSINKQVGKSANADAAKSLSLLDVDSRIKMKKIVVLKAKTKLSSKSKLVLIVR